MWTPALGRLIKEEKKCLEVFIGLTKYLKINILVQEKEYE